MTTATEPAAALPFVVGADQLKAHQADLARRAKEREAKRDILRSCLDPRFAAKLELAKPVYSWSIKANFDLLTDAGLEPVTMDEKIAAKDENEAWAKCCDKLGVWPSRRDARPTIKKIKQLDADEISIDQEQPLADKPRRKLTPKPKVRKSL